MTAQVDTAVLEVFRFSGFSFNGPAFNAKARTSYGHWVSNTQTILRLQMKTGSSGSKRRDSDHRSLVKFSLRNWTTRQLNNKFAISTALWQHIAPFEPVRPWRTKNACSIEKGSDKKLHQMCSGGPRCLVSSLFNGKQISHLYFQQHIHRLNQLLCRLSDH